MIFDTFKNEKPLPERWKHCFEGHLGCGGGLHPCSNTTVWAFQPARVETQCNVMQQKENILCIAAHALGSLRYPARCDSHNRCTHCYDNSVFSFYYLIYSINYWKFLAADQTIEWESPRMIVCLRYRCHIYGSQVYFFCHFRVMTMVN